MTIARFVETLLVRDIFSYLVPGFLILVVASYYGLDFGSAATFTSQTKELVGSTATTFVMLGVAYVAGYLASTFLFYVRKIPYLRRRKMLDLPREIREELRRIFGVWTRSAESPYLVDLCLDYVELKEPAFYLSKIERRVLLRNLEMSLAALLMIWALGIVFASTAWSKVWAVIPLIGCLLLIFSSKRIEGEMDNIALRAFYGISLRDRGARSGKT
jgi:hypothetical protein